MLTINPFSLNNAVIRKTLDATRKIKILLFIFNNKEYHSVGINIYRHFRKKS